MSDLKDLENAMNILERTVHQEMEELKKAVQLFLEGTKKARSSVSGSWNTSQASASSGNSTSKKGKKKSKKMNKDSSKESVNAAEMIDFDIPICYGTIELRETLTAARKKLTEAIEMLAKTRQQLPSHYVQAEMDALQKNFVVLREALAQMAERMEMNVDDYTDESPII